MTRTVLTFEKNGERTNLKLDVAPIDVPGIGENTDVDLTALPGGTLVQRGDGLLALLCGHVPVRDGLTMLLRLPPGTRPSPLYFHVRDSAADAVAWEQIHAAVGLVGFEGFVALDRRWPIGRIARRVRQLEPRQFTPPLRVLAVLSAAGRDGVRQLRALAAARDAAGFPIDLRVISGDDDLRAEVQLLQATFEPLSGTGPGLMRQIADAQPDILHVLCHDGGFAVGERRLAFASGNDFDAVLIDSTITGSVLVPVNDLVAALLPVNPWLVVLAACETSAVVVGPGEGLAVAHDMVSAGLPAVVGMRRLVDISATDAFAAEFYPAAFALIRQAITPDGAGPQPAMVSIDWAEAMTGPRRAMSGRDPGEVDSWTDPVLYAQDGPLQVFLPSAEVSAEDHGARVGKIDQLKGGLAGLAANGAPAAALEELRQRIAALEAELAAPGGPGEPGGPGAPGAPGAPGGPGGPGAGP